MENSTLSNPLVSVLIPNYNHGSFLAEAIESVLAQTYDNLEIIITDNASTDNSREVIEAYAERDKRIKMKFHDSNLGAVRNWDSALNMAEGAYCKILFSDDTIEPDFIATGVEMLKDSKVGFYYTAVKGFGASDSTYFDRGNSGLKPTGDFIRKHCCYIEKLPVSPGCALFRMRDFKRFMVLRIDTPCGVDPCAFGYGSDLLLFLKTAQQYSHYYYDNRYLSRFRAHETSLTVSNQSNQLGNARHHLFYLLAKAQFLSEFPKFKDILPCFHAVCWLLLKLYRNNDIGIRDIKAIIQQPLPLSSYYMKIPISAWRIFRLRCLK